MGFSLFKILFIKPFLALWFPKKYRVMIFFSLLSFQRSLATFGLRCGLKLVCWAGLGYWNKGILRTKEGTKGGGEVGEGAKGGTKGRT